MKDARKSQEVQFYLDRTIDSAVRIMRSIVENPSLDPLDRIEAMKQIADFHGSLALDLHKAIHGTRVSLALKESEKQGGER